MLQMKKLMEEIREHIELFTSGAKRKISVHRSFKFAPSENMRAERWWLSCDDKEVNIEITEKFKK